MTDKDRENYIRLLQAIAEDDTDVFSELVKSTAAKSIRFGRFPLLSLLYLYNSQKLIKLFEKDLCRIQVFNLIPEDFSIYLRFKEKAGRALRLYSPKKQIVTPLEMLAILGEDFHLVSSFPDFYKTEESTARIIDIYRLKWKRKATERDNALFVDKGPLGKKRGLAITLISSISLAFTVLALLLSLLLPTSFGGNSKDAPFLIKNSKQTHSLFANDSLDFSSLMTDVVLEGNYSSFSGNIEGNGKTVSIKGDYLFEEFSGKISNVTFVFTKDQSISSDHALFAKVNKGTLENVTVKFLDREVAYAHKEGISDEERSEGVKFVPFVLENRGTIKECNLDVVASLKGESSTNGYFAGFAKDNYSEISSCKILASSKITADCVDIGAFCVTNTAEGVLLGCENGGEFSQSSASNGWNPNTAGMAITNDGLVENCKNTGNILSKIKETVGEAALESIASGCVINNNGEIRGFVNEGEILSENNLVGSTPIAPNAYVGGIALANKGLILDSKNIGRIYAISPFYVIAGGICAINFSNVYNSTNEGNVEGLDQGNATADDLIHASYVGGICGRNAFDEEITIERRFVSGCKNSGEIKASSIGNVWVGGIVGYNQTFVQESENTGNITAYASNEIVAGGIVGGHYFFTQGGFYQRSALIRLCISVGALDIKTSAEGTAFVGGGAGFAYGGAVYNSVFASSFAVNDKITVGGIVGLANSATLQTSAYMTASNVSFAVGKIAQNGELVQGNDMGCSALATLQDVKAFYEKQWEEAQ